MFFIYRDPLDVQFKTHGPRSVASIRLSGLRKKEFAGSQIPRLVDYCICYVCEAPREEEEPAVVAEWEIYFWGTVTDFLAPHTLLKCHNIYPGWMD